MIIYLSLVPLVLKQTPSDVSVLQSQNAQITFAVDGSPTPNTTWFFNGIPLQLSAKHKIETKENQIILNINQADFIDAGTYIAVFDNGIEKIAGSAKLTVRGNFKCLFLFYIYTVVAKIIKSSPYIDLLFRIFFCLKHYIFS